MLKQCLLIVAALLCVPSLHALTFEIEPGTDIVGEVQSYTVQKGDTFAGIARKFDLGYTELAEANPKVNDKKALVPGTILIIPTEFVLPNSVPNEGIVLNLAEMRLYYFPPNSNTVVTFPVSIGRQGWKTPIGETKITLKRENPVWVPPASIRAEAEARGRTLPTVVAAGPNNPLGKYCLNLGWSGYRVHGTNVPSSIGLRVSHGCIRMFPEDIESLFHLVDVGTKVTVVHEPFKVGVKDGNLYLEAHQPFAEAYYTKGESEDDVVETAIINTTYPTSNNVNWIEVKKLIKDTYGYPVQITNVPSGMPAR